MSIPTVYYLDHSLMSSQPRKRSYKMPKKIPSGDILIDSAKNQWIIQTAIGMGGFGEIYAAANASVPTQNNFVIKIEPSENGPLFCEKTVYIRIGKKSDINEFKKSKGLKSFGMPTFYGSGVHSVKGEKYRFLVMDRYGKDLWSIFLEQRRIFPASTVYKVAIQVLDVLEYIHMKGYVHADIKGTNLLLGKTKGTENQVYLVDYGLSARYTHQYKPDPRRAHNGTIEYTSRDGHEGVVTRRGDIEILGYNLLHWLSSNLPWEGSKDLNEVQAKKIRYMRDYTSLLKFCFKNNQIPKPIENYFKYLSKMGPLEQPDYDLLRGYLREGLKKLGDTSNKLEFDILKVKSCFPPSPPPPKLVKSNNGSPRKGRRTSSRTRKRTVETSPSDSSSEACSEGDVIEGTPERMRKTKRSWKDCPSVVSCAELVFKEDKGKRTRRNK